MIFRMRPHRPTRAVLAAGAIALSIVAASVTPGIAAGAPTQPLVFKSVSRIQSSIASFTSTLSGAGAVDLSGSPTFVAQVSNYASDRPSGGCIAKLTATSVGNATCTLGDVTSRRVVVLFGDSHAYQWIDVLAKIAKARHWKLVAVTKAGCPDANITYKIPAGSFFPWAWWGKTYVACTTWRKDAFSVIASLNPYEIVTSGDTYLPSQVAGESVTLRKLVKAVRGHDRSHILYIADTPRGSYGAKSTVTAAECLAAANLTVRLDPKDTWQSFADNPNVCYRSYYLQNNGPSIRSGVIAAARAADARVVDPRPWLCDTSSKSGMCPPEIDGTLLYTDTTHLTDTYVLRLQHLIEPGLPST